MATFYRSGNSAGRKTKRAGRVFLPVRDILWNRLLGHFDAGELEGASVDGAFYDDMVAGVGSDFVLRVDGVNLFVAFVHEDILGAVLLHAPGGAFSAARCVKEHGAKYVFVNESDKKVYTVDAQDKVAPHAGHHVVVKGAVDGSALKLTSIEMAK